MNPHMNEPPRPITGDVELPNGTVLSADHFNELAELLTGPMRQRHLCVSKDQLQKLAGQLLLRNRLLEIGLAEAQEKIAQLQSPIHTVTLHSEHLPKMTAEEMANFERLMRGHRGGIVGIS